MTNKSYRCCFADSNDRVQSNERIECPDDVTAVLRIGELLTASKQKTAELWQGSRLVGKWGTGLGNANLKLRSH